MDKTVASNRVKIAWRLERLPSSSYLMLLGFLLIVSYFLESVDNAAIGYFLPIIAKEFNIGPEMLGYVGTISNVGVVVGALFAGIFTDTIGRKKIIVGSMIIWGVFGILLAYASSVEVFMIARVGIGLGFGAQVPATLTLLSEIVPAKLRAAYITAFMAMVPIGAVIAGGLSYFLIPSIGWRGVALIEALFFLFSFVLIKYLPESAVWLESKRRFREADEIMTMIEKKVEKSIGHALPVPEIHLETETSGVKTDKIPMRELFSKNYIRSTIMVSLWWPAILAATVGLGTWFSALMVAKGFTISKSIGYVSLMYMGGVLGVPLVRFLLKRIGRKWTTALMPALVAVAAYFYGVSTVLPVIIIFGLLYNMLIYGSAMTNNVYTPELFPTRIRGTAMGYANSIGRFGAIFGPIVIGMIMQNYGVEMVFYFAAGLFLFCGIAIAILGRETGEQVFTE